VEKFTVDIFYKKNDRPFGERLDTFVVEAKNAQEAKFMADEMAQQRLFTDIDEGVIHEKRD